jgi:hypothetical protein
MDSVLWSASEFDGAYRQNQLPAWLTSAYAEFLTKVEDETFPCTFGIVAHRKGDLYYAYADTVVEAEVVVQTMTTLQAFVTLASAMSPVNAAMSALTIFIKPDGVTLSLDDYFHKSWALLQAWHERDPEPWPSRVPTDPNDPAWSFCFGGLPIFVNFHTPAHVLRRSRGMKSAFTLLIQPRDGFDVVAGDHPKGRHARNLIRQRLTAYDGLPPHRVLGHYGGEGNREWQQYFLPDRDDITWPDCPFRS